MKIGKQTMDLSRAKVMTIVNVTPDSFYAQSRTFTAIEIEKRIAAAVEQGTDMIDVGGYSSRPGADDVSIEEEIRRLSTGVDAVRRIAPELPVSIDTFRAEVAKTIIDRFGACIINDISAGELDPQIVEVAAKERVPYIAMHMRGTPQDMQRQTTYRNLTAEVCDYLERRVEQLHHQGVEDVIIDPGFGFAKTTEQNFELLAGLEKLKEIDAPMLVGVSRKSMIYKTLGITPAEALNGTTAIHWECLRAGAKILRVHDTREAVECVKLFNTMLKWEK